MATTNRIEYIDALRGVTMLLVVLNHSYPEGTFLHTAICKFFRMPLFFFISGYLVFDPDKVWSTYTLLKDAFKKTRIQVIPTFFFGLFFTFLYKNGNFLTFIYSTSKQGYWFTLALFGMFLVYYLANYLLHQNKKDHNDQAFIIAMLVSMLGIYLVKVGSLYSSAINDFMVITSFYYLPYYFPHFIFGIFAAKYKQTFEKMIDNLYFMAAMITIFSIVLGFRSYLIASLPGGKELSACVLSFTGIIVVYTFFRRHQAWFSCSTKLGATLQCIGKRTLDIYLLHYFFLPYLPNIQHLWGDSPNLLVELSGFVLSFWVIGCCLVVSRIIKLSGFLSYWLLGGKK